MLLITQSILFIAISFHVVDGKSEYRDVMTEQGVVRGYNVDEDGVFSYYGIPYATAPTGEDRYKAPLPPPKWTGVFNATDASIICPQKQHLADTFLDFNRTIDCLRINIFMPNTTETKLPVMIYIHGGSFQTGFGILFNPVALAQKGIIAVNFNYRMGIHGFLCLGTEFAPGNAGLKDGVAAMNWVKKNIAQFGGDADNVALAGSSSGSMMAELLMIIPATNGLFSKAVSESGSALAPGVVTTEPLSIAESFANQFGLRTNENSTALETFYRELTDEELSTASLRDFLTCIETNDIPGVEKIFVELPKDILVKGKYEKRPYLTGFTSMEGIHLFSLYNTSKPLMEENFSDFLPSNMQFKSDEDRESTAQKVKSFYFPTGEITHIGFIDFYTDIIFAYPQYVSARLHAHNAAPVFLYLFSYNGTVNLPTAVLSPIWGPSHVAQSLYVQDYVYRSIYDHMTEEDRLMQERLRDIYVHFFKYGEPLPSLNATDQLWPSMTKDVNYYLDIDTQLSLREDPLKERFDLWDQVYHFSVTDSAANAKLSLWLLFLSFLFAFML